VVVDVTVWTFAARPATARGPIVLDILARALGTTAADVRIDRRCRHCGHPEHGKPFVAGAAGLSFNVSHSGDVAVVAVALHAEVGADVEVLRPRRFLDRLATRVLTDDEYARWCALSSDARLEAFLRSWTGREAYLKAIGLGLRAPLRDALSEARGWTIAPIRGLTGAVGSVAVDAPARVTTRPYGPVP